jgi:hypothetical protein
MESSNCVKKLVLWIRQSYIECPKTNIPIVKQATLTLHSWELRTVFTAVSAGTHGTVFV